MLWLALGLLLLVVLCWVVTLLFQLSIWIGIGVTIFCLLTFLTVFVIRRVRAALRAFVARHP